MALLGKAWMHTKAWMYACMLVIATVMNEQWMCGIDCMYMVGKVDTA